MLLDQLLVAHRATLVSGGVAPAIEEVAPFAVLAAATLGTILLVRRWSAGKPAPVPSDISGMDPAERERLQQIRRETGDGGF